MPRVPRNYNKTCFFHIMIQGINKEFIFDKPEDIKYYIKLMYKLKDEYNLKIIAYCIMNNHAHLLINSDNIEKISKYMQRINIRYSHFFNKKYNRVGYVFRDRYKSEGIYNEKHLYNCIKYIYDNPVKAGICLKPSLYPYSNYKEPEKKYEEEYRFIDTEEETKKNYRALINKILTEENCDLINLEQNEELLKKMINFLREKYKLSFRKISNEININREKIRRIYKK